MKREFNDKESSSNSSSVSEDNININFYKFLEKKNLNEPYSIIIEAPILVVLFQDEIQTEKFLSICYSSNSVLCCRVSPFQKSQIVHKMKLYAPKSVTLAIGDGGNDVSMIMEANVGIGIKGEEGMSAAEASDFSIGEFKLLKRLLFFHGRTNLNRISHMILYFFYKNIIFTIAQLYFGPFSLLSGQTIMDDWYITCYNLIFTALPLGVQALTNFDVLDDDYEIGNKLMPLLYKESNLKCVFSKFNFFIVLVKAILFSLINYFFTVKSFIESSIGNNGIYGDIWSLSLMLYTSVIFIVSFSLIIKQLYHVWIFPFVLILTSWLIYFCFCSIVQYSLFFNSVAIIFPTFQSGKFWINLVFVCGICFLIDFLCHSYAILFSYNLCNECILYRKYKNNTDKLLECSKIIKNAYDYVNYNVIKSETTLKNDSNKESEINLKSSIIGTSEMNIKKKELNNLKEEEEHFFDNSHQILKNMNENKMLKVLNFKEKVTLSTNNSPSVNRGEKLNLNFPNKNYYKGITKVPEERSDN
jgi:phospholipid-transporting ATPase